jgi:hypothetical protein
MMSQKSVASSAGASANGSNVEVENQSGTTIQVNPATKVNKAQ